jgi:hypothetical protein
MNFLPTAEAVGFLMPRPAALDLGQQIHLPLTSC